MRTLTQNYLKRTVAIVISSVSMVAAVFVFLPAIASAANAVCYNQLGGNLPYDCVQDKNTKVAGSTAGDPAPFKVDKCYTLADAGKGWEISDCGQTVFDQKLRGVQPIPTNTDATNSKCKLGKCDIVAKVINPIITFLIAVVGIAVTISIIIGGIQYATAADDPQKVSAAKKRIYTALLALGAFIMLWAFLQWLLPGGTQ